MLSTVRYQITVPKKIWKIDMENSDRNREDKSDYDTAATSPSESRRKFQETGLLQQEILIIGCLKVKIGNGSHTTIKLILC